MMYAPFGKALTDARQVHLRILATSDLHMHLLPFDYARNRPSVAVGLARTAGLIAAARADARNVLLLDNGDFLQGNPMADLAAMDDGPHPAIEAMNLLGYDAVTLGNHEFNYGVPVLMRALQGAAFPVVSANAATRQGARPLGDRTLVAPWAILRREVADQSGRRTTLKIGVIGLLPPQVAVWDRDHVAGRVWFRDMVQVAAARVPELREAGADIVVALAHTGLGAAAASDGMENAALPLARITGIDALVTGHSHLVFPSPRFVGLPGVDSFSGLIEGKPAVMPGAYGSHLGVIDLLLEEGGSGWRVAASASDARPILRVATNGRSMPQAAPVKALMQAATPLHDRTRAWTSRRIGRSRARLCTHFALVADNAVFRLVAAAKAAFVAERLAPVDVPVLGSAAPFRTGGRMGPLAFADVPAGPLTARQIAEIYPFPNTIRAVRLTGAQVRDWLEQSATLFRTVAPGDRDVPLFDPDVPGYAFDMIAGLTFDIRVDQPAGQRIADLRHAGRPVEDAQAFIVATNSYRASASAPDAVPVLRTDDLVRDVLERHVAAGGAQRLDTAPGWRLVLPPDASVTFLTSPSAKAPPGGLGGLAVCDLGLVPSGFRQMRLSSFTTG